MATPVRAVVEDEWDDAEVDNQRMSRGRSGAVKKEEP